MTMSKKATFAYREAIATAELNHGKGIVVLRSDEFKALYVENPNYGIIFGENFAQAAPNTVRCTALKFKAVLGLVQDACTWITLPAARAAHMGLDNPTMPVFCARDLTMGEALQLVKATAEEEKAITKLWLEWDINEKGEWEDPDIGLCPLPMPPTKVVIELIAAQ